MTQQRNSGTGGGVGLGASRYVFVPRAVSPPAGVTKVPVKTAQQAEALVKMIERKGKLQSLRPLGRYLPERSFSREGFIVALRTGSLVAYRGKVALPPTAPTLALTPRAEQPVEQEKVWVSIQVVDDETDAPLEGIKLEVTLPDGTIVAHTTGADGKITERGFLDGKCSARFAFEEVYWEDALIYAGTGAVDRGESTAGDASDSESSDEEAQPTQLVRSSEYILTPGESLDEVVAAHGITFEQFARFNWDHTDRAKVEKIFAYTDEVFEESHAACDTLGWGNHTLVELPSKDAPESSESESSETPEDGRVFFDGRVLIPQPVELALDTLQTLIVRARVVQEAKSYVSLVLFDDDMEAPLSGLDYRIEKDGAEVYSGTTDEFGALEHGPVVPGYYLLFVDGVPMARVDEALSDEDDEEEFEFRSVFHDSDALGDDMLETLPSEGEVETLALDGSVGEMDPRAVCLVVSSHHEAFRGQVQRIPYYVEGQADLGGAQ